MEHLAAHYAFSGLKSRPALRDTLFDNMEVTRRFKTCFVMTKKLYPWRLTMQAHILRIYTQLDINSTCESVAFV